MSGTRLDWESLLRFLSLLSEYDKSGDSLFWRTDGEYAPLSMSITCSDFFYLACADCEEIFQEDLDDFEQALKDANKAAQFGSIWGDLLWCARKRRMRPHPYYLSKSGMPKELYPLFNACGPERE